MTRLARTSITLILLSTGALLSAGGLAGSSPGARQEFNDRRDPPSWRFLDATTKEAFDLGQLVFNTTWVPSGTERAARRDGLGPLYVLGSCDGCHNNGARGRGEPRGDRLPNSFVMQLGGPETVYGAVLNTQALEGYVPEGRVTVKWIVRSGRYADGSPWQLREPRYEISDLAYGDISPNVVLRPRIGPALFGSGLLESVPVAQIQDVQLRQPRSARGDIAWREVEGKKLPGRFGWQADAVSIEDQTARALAREMGLTSTPRPLDDCTEAQSQCRIAPNGGSPEVSDEFLHALVTMQKFLAVPSRGAEPEAMTGQRLFEKVGCVTCHQSPLTAVPEGSTPLQIDAFTDLMVHDLGDGLADRTIAGKVTKSHWRTAPLWGMAHAIANGDLALMHDGRARSVEEAVLWHDGQARSARRAFESLPVSDRQALLRWVESL